MYNSYEIALRIKLLAKQNKISISALLSECNIGCNAMSHMSEGSMPKADNLAKIADCLNTSVDYLLGRTDDPIFNSIKKK